MNELKEFDKKFHKEGYNIIAGVDEAGRGPLAGPVVAASVIFSRSTIIDEINDSKKLTEKKREYLFDEIKEKSLSYSIGIIENDVIDKINILQAALKAMKKSVDELSARPDLILIDGNKTFLSEIPSRAIVQGDSKSFSIAAASILAKVVRDNLMIEASTNYPVYRWEKNKGYATKQHIEAIKASGYSEFHRKTFLRNICREEELNLF